MNDDTSVVICCAGMGTRLGIGSTKALINIQDKPLIVRQLELLKDFSDIRIVVGYQAEKVINVVNSVRKDIMFSFNYDFATTGIAESLKIGARNAREYIMYMDGDLIVEPQSFKKFVQYQTEAIAVAKQTSDEPVMLRYRDGVVTEFSESGNMEWPGLAKIKYRSIHDGYNHVYDLLRPLLPIRGIELNTREIDTQDDYERVILWVNNGYR